MHATVDLGGQVRFGPDVEWVDSVEDLTVDPARALKFYAEISKYWPGLPEGSLVPDYCGIRPKLQEPHSATALDFMIQGRGGAQGHGKERGARNPQSSYLRGPNKNLPILLSHPAR